jgi:hypothetical protein
MGIFNWNKKTKVNLTKEEKEELKKDQELLSVVAAINSQNDSTESPLASMPGFKKIPSLIYACYVGKLFMVKDAINNGSNVNETDDDGITPLHAAAEDGNIEIVQFLLNLGADKSIVDKNGILPIDLAKEKGHKIIVDLLS